MDWGAARLLDERAGKAIVAIWGRVWWRWL